MTTEVILNGDFENTSGIGVGQTPDDWVSVDSEVQTEGTFFGNGSGNLALEVDGQSGNTTSYSQTFTVDELGGASLTFDMGMRQAADIGTDGATVDISAAGGGASIFSATILPSVAGSFENFAFDVDFPNTGDFTITFTEIGDDSSVGAVLDNVSLITICFTPKTPILTPFGEKLAGDLKIGDLVLTQDRGPQPIRFIYRRRMRAKDIARPILFEPGAVGNKERLLVSQQHRLLMRSTGPGYIFQTQPPLLVNALHLVNGRNIKLVEHLVFVEYIHIMFDQHELVWSSG
ncbi:MAG: Hint domain-containing protein, partial [Pikeienuella sp.]